jgi:hypothetical protein
MMATALVSCSGSNECRHSLEYLIEATHLPVEEVALMFVKKQEIHPLLTRRPMTNVHALYLLISTSVLALLENLYESTL